MIKENKIKIHPSISVSNHLLVDPVLISNTSIIMKHSGQFYVCPVFMYEASHHSSMSLRFKTAVVFRAALLEPGMVLLH